MDHLRAKVYKDTRQCEEKIKQGRKRHLEVAKILLLTGELTT
jgi:hypothetical protein